MNTNTTTQNQGFSLLEVLVALTILAVGIMAVMQLFPTSLRQTHIASERTAIATLARTELGRVRAGGVGSQLTSWATTNALVQAADIYQSLALYESWRSSVQRVGGDVDLFRVTFVVTTFDGREEKFVTYVTKN